MMTARLAGMVLAAAVAYCRGAGGNDTARPDAAEIVRRSIKLDRANRERMRDYNYIENVENKTLDGSGRVTKTETLTRDVIFIEGEPYSRLIARNGKPLEGAEKKKEDDRLTKFSERQKKMTPEERRKRAAEREERERKSLEFLGEIPDAYNLALEGEDVRGSRACWVIRATPRAGYRPRGWRASILPKTRGRLWIDKQLYQWVRVEAETLDTISFGLVLARVGKGTEIEFEAARVNDEVWLPQAVHVKLNARLMAFKSLRAEMNMRFSEYRKFRTDSRIILGEAQK
jgi:hypothetical protein